MGIGQRGFGGNIRIFLGRNSEEISVSFLGETWQKSEKWVYAFVVNDVVMYVGQTKKTLKKRMENYQSGRGRIKGEIEDVLFSKDSKEVLIYAVSLDEIKTKKINIEGEEYVLKTTDAFEMIAIGLINPKWNIDGKEKEDVLEENLPDDIKKLGFKFERVSEWKLEGEKISVDLSEQECEKKGWFYFFVSNDKKIIHVGTTDRTLEKRMGKVKNGKVEINVRINKEIKDILAKNGKVFVYAASNSNVIDTRVKNGIKEGIKDALEKEWNGQGKDGEDEND